MIEREENFDRMNKMFKMEEELQVHTFQSPGGPNHTLYRKTNIYVLLISLNYVHSVHSVKNSSILFL